MAETKLSLRTGTVAVFNLLPCALILIVGQCVAAAEPELKVVSHSVFGGGDAVPDGQKSFTCSSWKVFGRCNPNGAIPGECHAYNRGGTSGIHYYACCNNVSPQDPNPTCNEKTYQSASQSSLCGPAGSNVPITPNARPGCRITKGFSCGGCAGQANVDAYCTAAWKQIPGLCWTYTNCFCSVCSAAAEAEEAGMELGKYLTLTSATVCGDGECASTETPVSCPLDCCGLVSDVCQRPSPSADDDRAWNSTCLPECCGTPQCCITPQTQPAVQIAEVTFTSATFSWTPPAGAHNILLKAAGGGGGGGSCASSTKAGDGGNTVVYLGNSSTIVCQANGGQGGYSWPQGSATTVALTPASGNPGTLSPYVLSSSVFPGGGAPAGSYGTFMYAGGINGARFGTPGANGGLCTSVLSLAGMSLKGVIGAGGSAGLSPGPPGLTCSGSAGGPGWVTIQWWQLAHKTAADDDDAVDDDSVNED